MTASRIPCFLSPDRFRKKLTVIGIIGHTQGVTNATSPPRSPNTKMCHRVLSSVVFSSNAFSWSMTGLHKSASPSASPSVAVASAETADESTADPSSPAFSAASLASAAGSTLSSSATPSAFFLLSFLSAAFVSPLKEKSTLVGGVQLWSLHAPYSR